MSTSLMEKPILEKISFLKVKSKCRKPIVEILTDFLIIGLTATYQEVTAMQTPLHGLIDHDQNFTNEPADNNNTD